MFIYILPVLLSFIGLVTRSRSNVIFVLLMMLLFFVIGFRGPVDRDYISYQTIFNWAPHFWQGSGAWLAYYNLVSMEPGFLALNILLKSIGLPYQSIFVLHAALSSLAIYGICRNLPANRFLVFVVLYVFSFIGLWVQIRFGLASLIVTLAIIYWAQHKYVPAIFLWLGSLLFHNIGMAVVLVILVYGLLSIKNISIKIVVVTLLCLFLMISLFNYEALMGAVLVLINDRYEAYISEASGSRISLFVRLVFFILLFSLIDKRLLEFSSCRILLSVVLSSVFVWSFAWSISILYRVGVLFELSYCLFLVRELYVNALRYYIAVAVIGMIVLWRMSAALNDMEPYVLH